MNAFDYFFQQSKKLSKQIITSASEQNSYQDIYLRCLKIASKLRDLPKDADKILVISENSLFFIVCYLSILKSGKICIPINPSIEEHNFKEIINSTKAKYGFISNKYVQAYRDYSIDIISEDSLSEWINEPQFDQPQDDPGFFDGNCIAEIIFTSGSMGEQKGVMITHRNIMANTDSILSYLHLKFSDCILVVLPFYYCYGLSLLHTHLRVGGSLVLNNSFIFIGSVINDLIQHKCTGFAGVPSHYQILLRKSKDFKGCEFPDLRYVTQAGGKLHTAFIEEFIESFPNVQFYVMYGQTEATARLSYLPPDELKIKLGSVGKGIPGVTLKVVNEKGENVLPGEVGEIIAKGENIMLGYFNDEETTNQVIKDGWLHSGDIATVDKDGYIFIQSRKKEIIKVRGIRISPKEIEEVIVKYPGVIDCTIESETDNITGESLKATVYINEPELSNFSEEVIKQHCSKYLSAHKIPQKIIFDTKLTFNLSGKKSKF